MTSVVWMVSTLRVLRGQSTFNFCMQCVVHHASMCHEGACNCPRLVHQMSVQRTCRVPAQLVLLQACLCAMCMAMTHHVLTRACAGDHLSPRASLHLGSHGWGASTDKGQDVAGGGAVTPGRSKLGLGNAHSHTPVSPGARTPMQQEAGSGAMPATGAGQEFLDADVGGASESDVSEIGPATGGPQQSVIQVLKGCLPILENLSLAGLGDKPAATGHSQTSQTTQPRGARRKSSPEISSKPYAGCSLKPRDMTGSALDVSWCYEDGYENTTIHVRSQDYMRTKQKIPSKPPLYTLAAADVFATESKQGHIARLVQLPQAGPPAQAPDGFTLPPLLIFNLQLPLYQAALFGPYDGPGVSIVFYFRCVHA